jgi:hypothetical protein
VDQKTKEVDFLVQNEGTIFLLTPLSSAANEWVSEHLPEDAMRFGGSIVVEHRFISPIVAGIQSDGLVCR